MMRETPYRQLVLILLTSTAISCHAYALDASGSAVKVDRITDAAGPGGERILETDGDVYMGDAIVTNPNGLAQIRFIDNTRIVVGPNSRMVIDKFVFNPDNTAREVSVSAIKGVFRFISGDSPSEAYSLFTPTMSIGVRGTVIDINARGPDSSVMFLSGSGTVCDAAGACIDETDICEIYVVPRGGGIAAATGLDRQQRLNVFFPFVANQAALNVGFQVPINCSVGDTRFFAPPEEPYGRKHASDSVRSEPAPPSSEDDEVDDPPSP
jgi:hypothetical protein